MSGNWSLCISDFFNAALHLCVLWNSNTFPQHCFGFFTVLGKNTWHHQHNICQFLKAERRWKKDLKLRSQSFLLIRSSSLLWGTSVNSRQLGLLCVILSIGTSPQHSAMQKRGWTFSLRTASQFPSEQRRWGVSVRAVVTGALQMRKVECLYWDDCKVLSVHHHRDSWLRCSCWAGSPTAPLAIARLSVLLNYCQLFPACSSVFKPTHH